MGCAGIEQTVIFAVGDKVFALELDRVESIIEKNRVTPVPGPPECVEGALFYRDRVLPVIDISRLLKLDHQQAGELLVVVRGEAEDFGISSDRIYGITATEALQIKYIPAENRENRFVCGVGKFNGVEFSLLDVGSFNISGI